MPALLTPFENGEGASFQGVTSGCRGSAKSRTFLRFLPFLFCILGGGEWPPANITIKIKTAKNATSPATGHHKA